MQASAAVVSIESAYLPKIFHDGRAARDGFKNAEPVARVWTQIDLALRPPLELNAVVPAVGIATGADFAFDEQRVVQTVHTLAAPFCAATLWPSLPLVRVRRLLRLALRVRTWGLRAREKRNIVTR